MVWSLVQVQRSDRGWKGGKSCWMLLGARRVGRGHRGALTVLCLPPLPLLWAHRQLLSPRHLASNLYLMIKEILVYDNQPTRNVFINILILETLGYVNQVIRRQKNTDMSLFLHAVVLTAHGSFRWYTKQELGWELNPGLSIWHRFAVCLDLGITPGVFTFECPLPCCLSSFRNFVVKIFLLESISFGKFPWPLGIRLEGTY